MVLIPQPDPSDIRRVDEDRWLASRFAPARVRTRLSALYAVNYEIARTAESVREPGLGAIRLQWWREALEDACAGKGVRAHPDLQALAAAGLGQPGALALWDAMISARAADFEAAPFADWAALDLYLDATAGGLMRLACDACEAARDEALIAPAARAWGASGLLRAAAFWATRGRTLWPNGESAAALSAHARDAYAQAKQRRVASAAFPALGYAALVPLYLRTAAPALLTRQLRLIAAAAAGRV